MPRHRSVGGQQSLPRGGPPPTSGMGTDHPVFDKPFHGLLAGADAQVVEVSVRSAEILVAHQRERPQQALFVLGHPIRVVREGAFIDGTMCNPPITGKLVGNQRSLSWTIVTTDSRGSEQTFAAYQLARTQCAGSGRTKEIP